MKYTNQSVFDVCGTALLEQGKKSEEFFINKSCPNGVMGCAYRGRNGLKCAIGHLIPDKFYIPEIENISVDAALDILERKSASHYDWVTETFRSVDYDLLNRLQDVHDTTDPHHWDDELYHISKDFELEPLK